MFDFLELPPPPKVDRQYQNLFPEMETEENEHGRFYLYQGQRYPSVTTVLAEEPDENLKRWIKNNPKKSEFYKDRGHSVHGKVEDWIAGVPVREYSESPMAELIGNKMFYSILPYLTRIKTVYGSEMAMVSPSLELAGRVDLVVGVEKGIGILDMKNTNKVLELEKIPKYCTQICAYAEMWKEWTGIEITQGIILNCTETGQTKYLEFDPRTYLPHLQEALAKWKQKSKTLALKSS